MNAVTHGEFGCELFLYGKEFDRVKTAKERSLSVIHQYKNNGYNIVLDVNSGSVHVVDDLVYDAIPLVEKVIKSSVSEAEMLAASIEVCHTLR